MLDVREGERESKDEVRDVVKFVARITWDMQIGDLLDLKSLAWNGCNEVGGCEVGEEKRENVG
jgi:hypothetical protein